MKREVEFVQFMLPCGNIRITKISVSPKIYEKALFLKEKKCRFEIEILTSGDVSAEIVGTNIHGEYESIAIVLCNNGPQIPSAINKLINEAYFSLIKTNYNKIKLINEKR